MSLSLGCQSIILSVLFVIYGINPVVSIMSRDHINCGARWDGYVDIFHHISDMVCDDWDGFVENMDISVIDKHCLKERFCMNGYIKCLRHGEQKYCDNPTKNGKHRYAYTMPLITTSKIYVCPWYLEEFEVGEDKFPCHVSLLIREFYHTCHNGHQNNLEESKILINGIKMTNRIASDIAKVAQNWWKDYFGYESHHHEDVECDGYYSGL
mmetsp:Transcript_24407/g.21326  ORF Transcript_24407/g.21326 Transcript_24407/m.21326 type:complete len:210 (-) Transcript_24407:91-720(-)